MLLLLSSLSARAQTTSAVVDGNRYVAQVLRNLRLHGNIDAKLRFESRLYDQKIVGQGTYQQGANLSERYTRWEMHTQIANQSASYVQVFDGTHLWTERRLPSRRQVSRLDIARLHAGLRTAGRAASADPRESLLISTAGQGGLAQLLADLLRNYDFQPPQTTQLDGLPVYSLVGTWRSEQLAKLWPAAENLSDSDPPDWPKQLPHHVLLMVQQQNLFPRVVENRTADDAYFATSLSGLKPVREPLLRYEIHEVNFAVAVPSELFEFNPGDSWSDETSVVLEEMKKGLEVVEAVSANDSISRETRR